MKQLLIIRHGKSCWGKASLVDFQRPLKNRGIHDAYMMGTVLNERGLIPDLLLMSDAKRTKETAKELLKSLPANPFFEPDLYDAGIHDVLNLIHQQDDIYGFMAIVGHNPTMTMLIRRAGYDLDYLPTSGVAHLTFDVEYWRDIELEKGVVEALLRPKDFR